KTAFPDGKPKDTKDEKKDDTKPAEPKPAGDSLKETKSDNTVVLFGDADMLYDQFSIRQMNSIFGMISQPLNNNLNLAQNLVEQMSGDNNLTAIRSRADVGKPFTRIEKMQTEAQERYQSKIKELETSLQEAQQKLNELQRTKEQGQQRFFLSPEQQTEV